MGCNLRTAVGPTTNSTCLLPTLAADENSLCFVPRPSHHPRVKTRKKLKICSHRDHHEPQAWGEVLVPECGIKPGMGHTTFESKKHGFRLQVQGDSVPPAAHTPGAGGEQSSGPITVAPLKETIEFEGGELEGVLEVHCLPTGRRFDAPLLLDFLVEPGDQDDPIMDRYGRIRYEVSEGCFRKGAPVHPLSPPMGLYNSVFSFSFSRWLSRHLNLVIAAPEMVKVAVTSQAHTYVDPIR